MPTIWQWQHMRFVKFVPPVMKRKKKPVVVEADKFLMTQFGLVDVKKLNVDAIMFATRMASSMADAQRLVKQGGVSFRVSGPCITQDKEHTICVCEGTPKPVKECKHVFRKAKDPREGLPEGWPIVLRCGDGHPRLTQRQKTKENPNASGYDNWVGAITAMIPTEGQTIEFWSKEWCFTKEEIEARMVGTTHNFITAVCEMEWNREHEQEFVCIEEVPTVTVTLGDVL